jgi:hypothetical protein
MARFVKWFDHFFRAWRQLIAAGMSPKIVGRTGGMMLTHVEFRSDAFPPDPDEAELINPGVYGRRLARFLVAGLRNEGFICAEPREEDWGWYITVENEAFDLWIGCSNTYDPDGFRCFIRPNKPFIRRFFFFKKIETRPRVEALQKAMDAVLTGEPLIRDKRWFTAEGSRERNSGG